jgi:hypothetical protein
MDDMGVVVCRRRLSRIVGGRLGVKEVRRLELGLKF